MFFKDFLEEKVSLDRFGDMLKFGINLKLSGPDEEKYYAQRLRFYISEIDEFDCDSENDIDLDIYVMHELVLKVVVKNSTLRFDPQSELSYDGIMVVLGFISQYHDKVQEDFRNDKITEEEVLRKVASPVAEEDEESSDDMEWV